MECVLDGLRVSDGQSERDETRNEQSRLRLMVSRAFKQLTLNVRIVVEHLFRIPQTYQKYEEYIFGRQVETWRRKLLTFCSNSSIEYHRNSNTRCAQPWCTIPISTIPERSPERPETYNWTPSNLVLE